MNDQPSSSPRSGTRTQLVLVALAVLVVGIGAWRGWSWWHARTAQEQTALSAAEQRLAALESRTDALRRDQRAQAQRLLDAAATNRVLRDEVLGLGQRGALLEESVAKLTDPTRHGAQALRLDEVELLLSQAAQRVDLAHDLAGARRAYALAAGALDGIDDHRLLNLKQALAQERAALDALGEGPQASALKQVEHVAASLPGLPRERNAIDDTTTRPAWQRWLAPLIDVRPTRDTTLVTPEDRTAADAALQIEISLARAALERDDDAAYRGALGRIDAWLPRLWPDSPERRQVHAQLRTLQATSAPARPTELGSTLQQLRALRNAGLRLQAPTLPVDPQEPAP